MVELHVQDDALAVEVQGLHQVWAFKRRIEVPITAVRSVRRLDPDEARGWWKGWRIPGTHLPGVIVAGTYYKDGERHFWDVRHPDRAIAIELDGAAFDRLFVEVADPDDAIRALAPTRAE